MAHDAVWQVCGSSFTLLIKHVDEICFQVPAVCMRVVSGQVPAAVLCTPCLHVPASYGDIYIYMTWIRVAVWCIWLGLARLVFIHFLNYTFSLCGIDS